MNKTILKEKIIEKYWIEKLRDVKYLTFLDDIESTSDLARSCEHYIPVPDALFEKIKRVSNDKAHGKFVFFIIALCYTLYRYTGQKDTLITSPNISLQSEGDEIDNFIFFRSILEPEDSVQQMIKGISNELRNNQIHDAKSSAKIVEKFSQLEIGDERALFQIGLFYNKLSHKTDLENRASWLFSFVEDNDHLHVDVKCKSPVPTWFITQITLHIVFVLHNLFDINQKVKCIPIMSKVDREITLERFNQNEIPFQLDKTFIHLFDKQVKKSPNVVALEFNSKALTYSELNRLSNRFANFLLTKYNIQLEDPIGLMMDRSEWLIIGVLGILKSGAMIIPIDITYPIERKRYMLDSAKARLLITEEKYMDQMKGYGLIENVQQAVGSEDNPQVKLSNDNLAYLVYTSGSTGKPKGIMQTHRCLVSVALSLIHHEKFKTGQRVLQFASIGFDVSIGLEMNFAFLSGATLCLIDENLKRDLNGLGQFIVERNIEWFYLPSSALNNMVEGSEYLRESTNSIGSILTGAEQVKIGDTLNKFLSNNPDIDLYNIYGPSETHYVTSMKIGRSKSTGAVEHLLPPIGKPIPYNELFILDKNLEPVVIGAEGEICISGAGLARGYLNGPEITSKSFIPHPFRKGERLYKTGDIGSWSPDGSISFGKRQDDQVKIRGNRVELTEIEFALNEHKNVDRSVVLAPDKNGIKELIAYVILKEAVTSIELQRHLKKLLPDYMIPGQFMSLETVPLTANDKVDKKALLTLADQRLDSGIMSINPKTAVEVGLKDIWQELLNEENISVLSNFFDLGGHSLKVTQLTHRIHKNFKVKLNVAEVYENPSLEMQAKLIEGKKKSKFSKIPKVRRADWYDISYAQRRLWILDQFEKKQTAYLMPSAYVMRNLNEEVFKRSLEAFIERHEILRTTFIIVNGEPKQQILSPTMAKSAVEYIDLRNKKKREEIVQLMAHEEVKKPFDLSQGPLFRASLVRLEEQKYIFLFTMHHIISDGWSLGIVVKEILELYNGFKNGNNEPIPQLSIQYKDYTAWHNQQLKGDRLTNLRAYWLKQFAAEIPVLHLPTDHPRPKIKTFEGGRIGFALNDNTATWLKSYIKREEASLFMVLLAVVNVFLHTYTHQDDIIIGSPIAGRDHPDLENQIGFYVNTLALRTRLAPEDSFYRIIEKCRETAFKAYENSLYPFDMLVDDLDLQRDLSRSPLFDVMVVLQNSETGLENGVNLEEVNVEIYPLNFTISKFDLNFSFLEIKENIYCSLEYNSDLFEKDTMYMVKDSFISIAAQLTCKPEMPISSFSLDTYFVKDKDSESNQSLSFDFN